MTQTSPEPVALPTVRDCPFDPPPELIRLSTEAPLQPLAFPDGSVGWLATGHEVVRTILNDARFSARMELLRMPVPYPWQATPAPPGFFVGMDAPEHTRYRKLLTGQFTVRRMKRLTPHVERITESLLDAMEEQGAPADLVDDFALPLPSLVICELLGVPYDTRDSFQLHAATTVSTNGTPEQMMAAHAALDELMLRTVTGKRAAPADDIISGLVADGGLTDAEIAGAGKLLLVAGHETTANMLSLGAYALISKPRQLALLREDPGRVDSAVEELMRYLSIGQFGPLRAALEDVEVAGQVVRKGDVVMTSIPAANRDPERFERPHELDVGRSAAGHLAFGHGIHQCIGQHLARIEMRVGYSALFRRFPGLRPAVPAEELPLRTDMFIYGMHRFPVTW
ncbi:MULTISPECIES: cytochrome P450 [Streptomyces]|uniref:Cytochrome P450 n=1 Tax=Streptomyces marokkonensis TaxID=324855 RepID=A0ABW6QIB7_9ACTN|nr:cytochrome P450 [Streptomyces marokkonensis]